MDFIKRNQNKTFLLFPVFVVSVLLSACTGEVPGSFRYAQQEESFSSLSDVNTKLDILWVIDNSGSMANEQVKIREGFKSFSSRYMKSTWDIRLAVITTDTYLASPAFTGWLDTPISGSANYVSSYINGITSGGVPGRSSPIDNPAWAPGLLVWDGALNRWKFSSAGITTRQSIPHYGTNWAKLLDVDPNVGSGNHDGPMLTVCSERSTGALSTNTKCYLRDDTGRTSPVANQGIEHCVNPDASLGEAAVNQCVNTSMNDTVHSGKSIISTYGVNSATLINQFIVNASVGIIGNGTEQSMNSILQLIRDNEATASTTRFFRPGALRAMVIVSDEEDTSIVYPINGTQVTPTSYLSTSSTVCRKTVKNSDGSNHTYSISQCPNPSITYPNVGAAIPVSVMKSTLDSFFRTLDGDPTGDPNYFIAVITALTGETVRVSGDQATRDLQLADAVGNGSLALEITSTDYTPLLDAIGQVIVQKKAVFQIGHEPASTEWMLVKIVHQDGSETIVSEAQYSVSGKVLTITDDDLVLSLSATDQVVVNYQPKNLN